MVAKAVIGGSSKHFIPLQPPCYVTSSPCSPPVTSLHPPAAPLLRHFIPCSLPVTREAQAALSESQQVDQKIISGRDDECAFCRRKDGRWIASK